MRLPPLLLRWLRFNAVGAAGVAVQLLALHGLLRGAGMHYLGATALAVELALLHNFLWHALWTWRDRPGHSAAHVLQRLWRFHLLNGGISLVGNLALMGLFSGAAGLDPLLANVMAITMCSFFTFAAGNRLVFRQAPAVVVMLLAPAAALAAPSPAVPPAGEPEPHTVRAWNAYQDLVDARYKAAPLDGSPFFTLDAFAVDAWRAGVRRGEVVMAEIPAASPGAREIDVKDGRIHHWAGAIFIPGATLDGVLARISGLAGREQDHYDDVVASKLLGRQDDGYRIFMRLRRSHIVTVTYNTEHAVQNRRLAPGRATAKSVATRIAEIEEAGTPGEREKPPGDDSGYLWRLNAYWRYQAVDGGVLIECESVSLSRGIPFVLRPFITGMVERVARDSLERTLTSLRKVLVAR